MAGTRRDAKLASAGVTIAFTLGVERRARWFRTVLAAAPAHSLEGGDKATMETESREDDNRLWVACEHVREGMAPEVWCRPERIAVCPECLAQCIGNVATAIVRGREHLERDLSGGHCHES